MTASKKKMVQKDYMGIVVVNHYLNDRPLSFFGVDTPSPNVTELAFYSAAQNKETGEIVKQEELARVRFSEFQFAQMLGQTSNGIGRPATLISLRGYDVARYVPDIEGSKLAETMKHYLDDGASGWAIDMIDDMLEEASEANVERRLTKKQKESLIRNAGMVRSFVSANEMSALDDFKKASEKRTQELMSSIHSTVRDAQRIKLGALPLADSTLGGQREKKAPHALLDINTGGSGSTPLLFDGDGIEEKTISIKLSGTDYDQKESVQLPSDNYVAANLSLLQYARTLRADSAEVPCTYTRIMGKECSKMDRAPRDEVMSSFEHPQAFEDYRDAIDDVIATLETAKGVALVDALPDKVKNVKRLYELYVKSTYGARETKLEEVIEHKISKIKAHFEREIAGLTNDEKEKVFTPLSNLLATHLLEDK